MVVMEHRRLRQCPIVDLYRKSGIVGLGSDGGKLLAFVDLLCNKPSITSSFLYNS